MLVLLISWAVLLGLCFIIASWLKIKEEDFFLRLILSLSALSVYLHVWAIFLPAKYALIPLILFSFYAFFGKGFRKRFINDVTNIYLAITARDLLVLLVLLFLASAPSFVNDNAAYYQQTIKWFAQYGFVPGVANIHLHLGLGSAWHLVSSALYFQELPVERYYNFNGLVLWALIVSLQKSFPKRFEIITISLLLVLGALLSNAPSPDLIILAGTLWVLLNIDKVKVAHLAIIVGFLISVKISAVGLLFFFLPLYHKMKSKREVAVVLGILSSFGFLVIVRNVILTGYPFFPMVLGGGVGAHQVPELLLEMFRNNVVSETFDQFQLNLAAYYDLVNNYWDRFLSMFMVRKYKVAMNVLCLLSFIIVPLFYFKGFKRKNLLFALAFFLNGIFWFSMVPNYRFVLGFVVFMFYLLIKQYKIELFRINNILFSGALLIIFWFTIKHEEVLYIVNCGEEAQAGLEQVFYPAPIQKVEYVSEGGFKITGCTYCYDVPLPCYSQPVMKRYISNFNFEVMPQEKGDFKEGFIMKKKPVNAIDY